ncbi:MAG TPA: SAM-dependent methyltransferase [Actinomycetota bacterium]|nr:SAM-dependent methyltransferase [Actinomycetota bacterium]
MSSRLRDTIIARIRAHGPMPFDEFMEFALYDPEDGFFSSASPAHPEGHFVTSPHLSPVFAGLLTVQARDAWVAMGNPEPFTVVDLGAGEGALARGIVAAAKSDEEFARALEVIAVERGEVAAKHLAESGLTTARSVEEVQPLSGVIVANELFDNVPYRLFGSDSEIRISEEGDRLIWQLLPPASIRPISPRSLDLIDQFARALKRGYAFIIDYGFTADEEPETTRGYRGHHLVTDVLEDPGATDVTGPVDFDALTARARENGLQTWGPVSQRDALMALGYRTTLDRMRAEQQHREQAGEWRTAIEYYGERGQAAMLVDLAGLGSLKVLALGTEGLPRPRALG